MFNVSWEEMPLFTGVPDIFIEKHLPDAPGEYVKIFLYLMMLIQRNTKDLSVDLIARRVNCSISEVNAALEYWKDKGVTELIYKNGDICSVKIKLNPSERPANEHRLSRFRVKTLMNENNDAKTLCYVTEQYLARPLTAIEVSTLLYFLDELKFSVELCEYLVEYCISKGHPSIRYIEKVGLNWHKNGYQTVEDAKKSSSSWSRVHFDVLKFFGISGRNPVKKEVEYIDKWYKSYCHSLEIIAEACAQTLSKTGKQSFEYADSILTSWYNADVKTKDDIEALDKRFREKQNSAASSNGRTNKNTFLNYSQRNDDLDEVDRILMQQFIESMEGNNGSD